MFYSSWWLYKNVYLRAVRQGQLNGYLKQVNSGEKPLFIHVNRTGGSSVASGLGITQIHRTLAEYELAYKRKFGQSLAVKTPIIHGVRNPFDRVASEYYYRQLHNQNNLKTQPIPFEDWVLEAYWLKNKKYRDRECMFMQQYKWIEAHGVYDFYTLRYESLEDDYNALVSIYGAQPLPWKKPSNKPEYKKVFTEISRAIVESTFKEDLNRYNYSY